MAAGLRLACRSTARRWIIVAAIWLPAITVFAGGYEKAVLHDFIGDCEGWVVQEPANTVFSHTEDGWFGRGALAATVSLDKSRAKAVLLKTYRLPLDLTEAATGDLVELSAWVYLPGFSARWDVLFGVFCSKEWRWGAAYVTGLPPGWNEIVLPANQVSDPSDIRQLKIEVICNASGSGVIKLDRISAVYQKPQ